MDEKSALIEQIRREEFGIGVEMHGEFKTIYANMTRKYRNLLSTVSEDLNSKESHFILELIQNADDNSYKPDVDPSLSFTIDGHQLVVKNNEVGFEEKNIRALCSAGESSKKNEKRKGYIGEKGIGFKSIFKVSDSPEIHSNGYHFRFDRSNPENLLGYVIPHWHEPKISLDERTTLIIPAKSGFEFSASSLSDISDSLLLFLQKLRRIDVETISGSDSYLREDNGVVTTLVTTKANKASTRQLFLRKTFKVDMSDIHEPKREGVYETEIVLAFPLGESGEATPLPGCDTYAFLPIRDFGFNFYIQADFVLASSREAIHEKLAWNIRLRDAISMAFVDALDEFKQRPELAKTYLKYLPTKEEVHDKFFAPVVDQLINKLKSVECIPVAGGGWKRPSEVLLTSGRIRELFPTEDSLRIFGADYLQDGFLLPNASKEILGFRNLFTTDVVSVFTIHSDWLKSQVVEWKARFYAYLAHDGHRKNMVELLKKIACLPLEGGELKTPSGATVFFPLNADKKYGFEHELSILDAELLKLALEASQDVLNLFTELGVKEDSPYDLILSHILKLHSGDSWMQSENAALIGHVRYIKDNLPQYLATALESGQQESAAITLLRKGLYIGTKENTKESWIFSRLEELYLGKEFKPVFDLESLLGDDLLLKLFVSPDYIRAHRSMKSVEKQEQDVAEWREFFAKIGVNVSPRVLRRESGDVECSEELKALLESGKSFVRRTALEVLDRNWDKYPSQTTYSYKSGRTWFNRTTSLITTLREVVAPTRKKTQVNLSSAYADNEEIRTVLGDQVVFVEADLRNTTFLDVCGITYKVNVAACLKRLQQMKFDDVRDREQIVRIYRCLERLWDKERAAIEAGFSNEQLIRVGRGDLAKWVRPNEACWKSTGNRYLDRLYPPLDGAFRDFYGFFVKMLKVPEVLSIENWLEGLKSIDEVDEVDRQEFALFIYRKLSSTIDSNNKSGGQLFMPDWLDDLDIYCLLLNRRGEMVDKSEHFYADDRPELSKLFEDEEEISFFNVTSAGIPSVNALLGALEIRRVSEMIKVEVSEGVEGAINHRLTAKLRDMLFPIARVIYGQSHASFQESVKNCLFNTLSKADVLDVESLSLVVTLGEWSRETSGNSASRRNEILLDSGTRSKHDYVAIELEKLLLKQRKGAAVAHIGRVLMAEDVEEANEYLEIQNIPELPESEIDTLRLSIERDSDVIDEPVDDEHLESVMDEVVDETSKDAELDSEDQPIKNDVNDELEAVEHKDDAGRQADVSALAGKQLGNPKQTQAKVNNTERQDQAQNADEATEADQKLLDGVAWNGNSTGIANPKGYGEKNYSKQKPTTRTGRLLSYAEPKTSKGESVEAPDSAAAARKKAVELAAVDFFKTKATSKWRYLEEMPPNNPGFDFLAKALDGNQEYIEIKGQSAAWTEEGVALTPTELLTASKYGEHYWLCVVEYAEDEARRRLWLVQDPFGKVDQFRFDRGWQDVAEKNTEASMSPEAGLFVTIPELGKAKILEVLGNGLLTKFQLELEDKSIVIKMFCPATMIVSED